MVYWQINVPVHIIIDTQLDWSVEESRALWKHLRFQPKSHVLSHTYLRKSSDFLSVSEYIEVSYLANLVIRSLLIANVTG